MRNVIKDLQIEFRSKMLVSLLLSFCVIVTISIGFASGGLVSTPYIHSILLWVIIFFAGMNTLSHIFYREIEEGTAAFALIYYSAEIVYVSKLIVNSLVMILVCFIVGVLYLFTMDVPLYHAGYFIWMMLVGGISLSLSTTIIAAISALAQARGGIFTVLAFPVILPLLTVVIKTTTLCFFKENFSPISAIIFLLAFSILLVVASYILFPYIWREF